MKTSAIRRKNTALMLAFVLLLSLVPTIFSSINPQVAEAALVWMQGFQRVQPVDQTSRLVQDPLFFTYNPDSLTSSSVSVTAWGGGAAGYEENYKSNAFAFTWTCDPNVTGPSDANLVWLVQRTFNDDGRTLVINDTTLDLFAIAARAYPDIVDRINGTDEIPGMRLRPNTTYRAWVMRLGDENFRQTTTSRMAPIGNALDDALNAPSGSFTTRPASIDVGQEQDSVWTYVNLTTVTDPSYTHLQLQSMGGNGTGRHTFYISTTGNPQAPERGTDGWVPANGTGSLPMSSTLILPKSDFPDNSMIYVWSYREGDRTWKDSNVSPLYSSLELVSPRYWFSTPPSSNEGPINTHYPERRPQVIRYNHNSVIAEETTIAAAVSMNPLFTNGSGPFNLGISETSDFRSVTEWHTTSSGWHQFTDLKPDTQYYVFAYGAGNDEFNDSPVIMAEAISTHTLPKSLEAVTITPVNDATIQLSGSVVTAPNGLPAIAIDLDSLVNSSVNGRRLFNVNSDPGTDARTYNLSSVMTPGAGVISGNTLYVTGAGSTASPAVFRITLATAETDTHQAAGPIMATLNVVRGNGAAVDTPVVVSRTHNSLTINPIDPPANGQSVEFGIATSHGGVPLSAQGGWRTDMADLTFNGLSLNQDYFIVARSRQNNLWNDGLRQWTAAERPALASVTNVINNANVYIDNALETISINGGVHSAQFDLEAISGFYSMGSSGLSPIFSIVTDASATGVGEITDNILTVTKAGTFTIGLTNNPTATHAADIVRTATLTVVPGTGVVVDVPKVDSKTRDSITIEPIAQPTNGRQIVEFGIALSPTGTPIGGWRTDMTDLTFTGLAEDTQYWIVARSKSNDLFAEGELVDYGPTGVELLPADHGSNDITVTYRGAAFVGDTIDLNTVVCEVTGKSLFEFVGGGARTFGRGDGSTGEGTISSAGILTVTKAGVFNITLMTAPTATHDGGVATAELTVLKAAGATVDVPTLNSRLNGTSAKIIMNHPIELVDNGRLPNGQRVEFSISTDPNTPGVTWQDGLEFIGIDSNEIYYVFARSKGNGLWQPGTPMGSNMILPIRWRTLTTLERNTLLTGGTVTVTAPDTLLIPASDVVNNSGTIMISQSSRLFVDGTLINNVGGVINNEGTICVRADGDIENHATITNAGDIFVENTLTNLVTGTINNYLNIIIRSEDSLLLNDGGVIHNRGNGIIEIDNGSELVNEAHSDVRIQNDGRISILLGGILRNLGFIMNRERVEGPPVVTAGRIINNGTIYGEEGVNFLGTPIQNVGGSIINGYSNTPFVVIPTIGLGGDGQLLVDTSDDGGDGELLVDTAPSSDENSNEVDIDIIDAVDTDHANHADGNDNAVEL